MSKKIFDPRTVPLYPQSATGETIDFDSDEIVVVDPINDPTVTGNKYIMRTRITTQAGWKGPWSPVWLPDYQVDTYASSGTPWSTSMLTGQLATLDLGQTSTVYHQSTNKEFVSAVNINLIEDPKYAVTGVNVWFRWMPDTMFINSVTGDIPTGYDQKTGTDYVPSEWIKIGTYQASSFTTAIPRSSDFTNKYFQILITDNTSIKPNKYNYRWVPTLSPSPTKIGEAFPSSTTRGYLPWSPYYSQATGTDPWDKYMRQRSTLQDIALFCPRRWQVI